MTSQKMTSRSYKQHAHIQMGDKSYSVLCQLLLQSFGSLGQGLVLRSELGSGLKKPLPMPVPHGLQLMATLGLRFKHHLMRRRGGRREGEGGRGGEGVGGEDGGEGGGR